ncbi:ATP-binding protein [Luteibacter sp. ME-Dv--P-043b]|uniref:sensor histidine kinase n=1 Tax=unclassified Luteibacter TaxID=2620188 RepID=UPI0025531F8B|nr:ATP-binding protein [Luteibacter sp. ME-Dv--P-043b]
MTRTDPSKPARGRSLWRWVAVRMSLLALGVVLTIALCMWLRFAIEAYTIERRIPPAIRDRIAVLSDAPERHEPELWGYLRQYYRPQDLVPGLVGSDWLLFYALVLASVPVIVLLGLVASRPLSRQFSIVAATARRVTQGDFSARAEHVPNAPDELNRLAADFNAMCEKLSRYEREVLDSSAILAHELRTPLNAAMGRLQGILDGVFEPQPEQLGMILRQLVQLNRLVSDLHFLSVARAGELRLSEDRFDLAELIAERVAWSSPALDEAGIACSVDGPASLRWYGDRDRLGQVVSVLIENVIRYAAAGRSLRIRLTDEGGAPRIAVEDRGPGVPPDELPRIFDRFWRAEHSRGRHSGGSGLGLSIASVVVEAHGGTIHAANRADGGLRVTVALPLRGGYSA